MHALLPKLQKSRKEVETTLFEVHFMSISQCEFLHQVVALEVALEKRVDAVLLASLMPKQWAEFIRTGPPDDIKDIGLISRTP